MQLEFTQKLLKQNKLLRYTASAILLIGIGYWLGRGQDFTKDQQTIEESNSHQTWTCSMHPQIRQNQPGQCPICGMDLIPVSTEDNSPQTDPSTQNRLKLSPTAIQLADIQTTTAKRKYVAKTISLFGKIDFDETQFHRITARFPGRIDRLYVNATGVPVTRGDHLAMIYSPDLLAAQQELIESVKSLKTAQEQEDPAIKETAQATVNAVREKLRLWELKKHQIDTIEKNQKPSDHMTIYSPVSGIVIHRNITEGNYIQTGSPLFTISDLEKVWAVLDAYESDIPWIHTGQAVTFSAEAIPGKHFNGLVSFIHPVLDSQTRTVKLRVNVQNPHNLLKPGMFIRANIKATIDAMGNLMDNTLVGKWICPMHPEIVSRHKMACPICGMSLVTTQSLGLVKRDKDSRPPLIIPASSVLNTGKRAVVYVEVAPSTYEGREVILGPRVTDDYIVYSGIKAGDRVVSNGNFKIDSAMQIHAKPAMMSPTPSDHATSGHHHQ